VSSQKTASDAGQDLRAPILGGTKFPTNDSKAYAKKQFELSSAEVGPVQPSQRGAKLQDLVPKFKAAACKKMAPYQQSRKGRRPIRAHNLVKKAGDPMDPIMTDPLVQYLKKEAAEGKVDDNLSDLPVGSPEPELASDYPCPPKEMADKSDASVKDTQALFDNTGAVEDKFLKKEHPYAEGVVDRILGLG
jgi:hypothetical protein